MVRRFISGPEWPEHSCASGPGDTVKENFMSSQRLQALTCAVAVAASLGGVRPVAAVDDIAFALREENVRIVGRDGSDQAGTAVAVGDVSGDGIGDILVGVPVSRGPDNRRDRAGEVAVVFGALDLQKSMRLLNAAHTFYGATEQARLGAAVAVGDVNGDGTGDVIMGAPEATTGGGGDGATYVFFGGNRLPSAALVDLFREPAGVSIYGNESGGNLGQALAIGDFNNDGTQDVAMAAPREGDHFSRVRAGAVYVLFGRPFTTGGIEITARTTGVDGEYILQIRGARARGAAGVSLAAGDVNGDGVDDLLIGAPIMLPDGTIASGTVDVLFGNTALLPGRTIDFGDAGAADLRLQGPFPGDRFGLSVAVANINGDGIADILIGAPGSEFVTGLATGHAYALFGRPFLRGTVINVRPGDADVTLAGPHHGAELGASLTGGDMNADGLDEWVVGAPGADKVGQAYRIAGRDIWSELGEVGALTQGARGDDRAGEALAIGDVSGDGLADLVVGAPLYDGVTMEHDDGGAVYVVYGDTDPLIPNPDCADADADGFRAQGRTCGPLDCVDADPAINPLAEEVCNDGVDNDCNGFIDFDGVDADGDGWPAAAGSDLRCVVPDCDDANPAINPGTGEQCADGIDNNCDGRADATDPQCVVPPEVCGNCVDDDVNGLTDVFEPGCSASSLTINEVVGRRPKKRPTSLLAFTVKGTLLDAGALADPRGEVMRTGLTLALALPGGPQLCIPLGPGRRNGNGGMVLKSAAKPRAVLSIKLRRNGKAKFRMQYKGALALPALPPMTVSVGFYSSGTPYLGAAELRTQAGSSLVRGGALQ
jgi:hypothetical protein